MTTITPLDFAADLVDRHRLTAADLVVEVGSGDGAFLRRVRAAGARALGVEPGPAGAASLLAGVDTLPVVFSPQVADHIARRYGLAAVVVTRMSLGASDELADFVAAAARCLAPGGVVICAPADSHAIVELRPTPPPAARPLRAA